ncbi:MAG TPA: pre-peptidase, partial [Cyanobacteria bacterium UBA12227]|nr:pre-peptidase [Cyanobacteria bacterium UBA12227]
VINRSTAGGSSNESINTQLNTGTYYVRVFPYGSANTNYNLSLNATPDYAGNSLSSARDIGTLNSSRSFSDLVGSADSNDYYRFYVG